ncbi:ATP-binding cassette sub-family C member 4-like [Schistocerca gregaria]|uniref:ATP-binding cassette sub-family C member 4-like n=1 Tax=Schistocerca gregaria TaxID=7010 RepID=UPI00211E601E|nr:ATP-binding cassette sub-family C member 4-like [Schistocerca gregaria]
MDTSSKGRANPNPRATANPVSILFFWWLKDLFVKGSKKDLEVEDLYDTLKADESAKLGDTFERNWREEIAKCEGKEKTSPSLRRVIIKTFRNQFILQGVLQGIQQLVVRILVPVFMALLLTYFNPETEVSKDQAYLYAAVLLLSSLLNIFIMHHTSLISQRIGMRIRVACCSLLYRKVIRLSKTAAGQTGAGQMVNLLSNDVSRFDMVPMFIHFVWLTPLQTIIAAWFIWEAVGWASIIGIVGIFLQTVPVQSYMSQLTSKFRLQIAVRTDYRVRIMTEIVSGIQVIKMYAWEKPFEKVVEIARRKEVKVLKGASYLRGVQSAFGVFTERTSLYVTLVAYALLGNTVTADKVFPLAQFFNIIQFSMAIAFPAAVQSYAEAKVSMQRLEVFLLLEEHVPRSLMPSGEKTEKVGIMLQNASARWGPSNISETLSNINLLVTPGKLCAIVGPVGSGKSSLLHVLLGELPLSGGTVAVGGDVSYASQDPWLFVGTVRQNILFGQEYEPKRYREVVRACALTRDFELFPQGDKTIVGERGVSLSGGQRARINLARAVYRNADIYLLDDPLSAVDTHVGKQLFEECISSYLCTKTRVLVTHQLQYLKEADIIVILNNGKIEAQGTFSELVNNKTAFSDMLASNQEDVDTKKQVSRDKNMKPQISVVSVDSVSPDDEIGAEESNENTEMIAKGKLKNTLYRDYFTAGSSYLLISTMALFLILGQIASSGSDYWITYWTNQEQMRLQLEDDYLHKLAMSNISNNVTSQYAASSSVIPPPVTEMSRTFNESDEKNVTFHSVENDSNNFSRNMMNLNSSMGTHIGSSDAVSATVGADNISHVSVSNYTVSENAEETDSGPLDGGEAKNVIQITESVMSSSSFTSTPLQRYNVSSDLNAYGTSDLTTTEISTGGVTTYKFPQEINATSYRKKREISEPYDQSTFFTRDQYILIYTSCIAGCIILTTIRALLFFKVALNSSQGLHNRMFNNVLKGTMRFFDTNPSGRILNRFSKDVGAVDELLPKVMLDAITKLLVMAGILTMVLIANYYFVFPMLIFGFLFYKIRSIYLRTGQAVKRLEGITKSPVFSYLSASLNGLTTIRSSANQEVVMKEYDSLQDVHTSSWYTFLACSAAFALSLDLISFTFVASVVLSFVIIDTGVLGGYVGLAIAQSLMLTGMLQIAIRETTEVVSQMTSVERILQYNDIEREPPFESESGRRPPKVWPDDGVIQFVHTYLRYSASDPPVLKDLHFTIKSAEKVGIVGRTGAGKSSLISALFRLAELEGAIYIDDIDTQTIGLHDLRKRISIIPQEPVLFSASLRYNLDPFSEFPDHRLYEVLDEVKLKEAVDGLDFEVSEGGSNFSVGQRQLVCLARAILRNNNILVLDEATANVDPQTDALIQQTIRKKFKNCTVLTIAHRLNTIMDSDKVLVMDAGTMVEFAHPYELLQNSDGHFYNMVQQTGTAMALQLTQIAEENYKNKHSTKEETEAVK